MSNQLFSFQGKIYTATRDPSTGRPSKLIDLGNVSKGVIELQPQISDKFESFSGTRTLYGRLMKERKGTVTLTIDELHQENLALALFATADTITGASVTGETFPTGLADNDIVALDNQFVSAVVIKDSNATPVTLVAGTDYKVISANRGIIQILNIGSFTQPFKADYTYGAGYVIPMMTSVTPPERYVVFDGVNTFTGDPFTLDLFRVQFTPAKQVNLVDSDWGGLELEGAIIYDSVNAANANFGGFGRLVTSAAAT
jgi:hypothetical protein